MNRNAYQNNSIGAQQQMDMITYHYLTGTNKLDYVDDQAPPQWSGDIKQQATANYKYDGISNLPHDVSEGKNDY